jgi:ATP-dependent DNA helicase RecQ
MPPITFIDTEIDPTSKKILDIGAVRNDGASFHSASAAEFVRFLKGAEYICGHNILNHDIRYIGKAITDTGINPEIIDTLFLSPLLFPTKPYHKLVKDDKLQSDETNNPLNDSIKAKELFDDEVAAFDQIDEKLKRIFYLLLNDTKEFRSFFHYIGYTCENTDLEELIRQRFVNEICEQANLADIISAHPVELAYGLSLINSFIHNKTIKSVTPRWVLKNYPDVEQIMFPVAFETMYWRLRLLLQFTGHPQGTKAVFRL